MSLRHPKFLSRLKCFIITSLARPTCGRADLPVLGADHDIVHEAHVVAQVDDYDKNGRILRIPPCYLYIVIELPIQFWTIKERRQGKKKDLLEITMDKYVDR